MSKTFQDASAGRRRARAAYLARKPRCRCARVAVFAGLCRGHGGPAAKEKARRAAAEAEARVVVEVKGIVRRLGGSLLGFLGNELLDITFDRMRRS